MTISSHGLQGIGRRRRLLPSLLTIAASCFIAMPGASAVEPASGGRAGQSGWNTTVVPAAQPLIQGPPEAKALRPAAALQPKAHPAAPAPSATSAPAPSAPASPAPAAQPPPVATEADKNLDTHPEYSAAVQKFCTNISPVAVEARAAWLRKTIAEHEQKLEQRISELEAKTAEHKEWLAKRQEFAKKVGSGLVELVSRMKPEAAAQQIALMDEETAAALIVKLDAKTAGLLLSEIPAPKAARLSTSIAAVASLGKQRRPASPTQGQAGAAEEAAR